MKLGQSFQRPSCHNRLAAGHEGVSSGVENQVHEGGPQVPNRTRSRLATETGDPFTSFVFEPSSRKIFEVGTLQWRPVGFLTVRARALAVLAVSSSTVGPA